MMESTPRKALGRGLAALIPGAGAPPSAGLRNLPIERVHPSRAQPRKHFDLDALKAYFKASKTPGWALVQWAKPTGAELEKVVQWLKGEKLTLRNVPTDAEAADSACIFTGGTAVERVLVGRSY